MFSAHKQEILTLFKFVLLHKHISGVFLTEPSVCFILRNEIFNSVNKYTLSLRSLHIRRTNNTDDSLYFTAVVVFHCLCRLYGRREKIT